jgi:ferric-dicitrate binding protein FerR (iron transport regulator)
MSSEPLDEASTDSTEKRVAKFLSAQSGRRLSTSHSEQQFLRRLTGFRRLRRVRRFALGAVVACALVVVGLLGSRHRQQEPASVALSYRVDSQVPSPDGYIPVPQAAESLVAFSDGSKVQMVARTRGRVMEVNDRGARFVLEEGKISVDVVPRAHAQWIFEAGPFRVNVHGTSFTVAWNPTAGAFDVHLTSGSISVATPIGGPEIQMRAGQSLAVNLRDQTVTIEPTIQKAAPISTGAGQPTLEEPRVAPPEPRAASAWSHRNWMAALSDNKAADIVAQADRHGTAKVLDTADSADLWALANAARYVGQYPLASQALITQRKRFPSSERAWEAAFLLGRLHDADPDGPGKAIAWYDRYLLEAREGADISGALGRKMTLLQRWQRTADALSVARDYLRRFPQGTYANAARALVRSSKTEQ